MNQTRSLTLILTTLTAITGMTISSSALASNDILACYAPLSVPGAEQSRLVIDIKPHSPLTPDNPEQDENTQFTFSLHGKLTQVCNTPNQTDTIATSTGTIVVSKDGQGGNVATGAHLGITTHSVRGIGITQNCFSVEFDCTSEETSPAPQRWRCFGSNESGRFFPLFTFEKVNPRDPRCRVFQDGPPASDNRASDGFAWGGRQP